MDERRKASISSLWLGDMEGARPTWTGATPAPACLAVLEFTSAGQPPQAGEHDLPEYRAHEDGPTVPVREHCAAAGAGGLVRGPIRRLMYYQASLNHGQQCTLFDQREPQVGNAVILPFNHSNNPGF